MDECECGVARRRYWLWRDGNGTLHASGFPPSNGADRSVIAASVRDALLPMNGGGVPKHVVSDVDDPSHVWDGRCSAVPATT